jgi:hypothetical protein
VSSSSFDFTTSNPACNPTPTLALPHYLPHISALTSQSRITRVPCRHAPPWPHRPGCFLWHVMAAPIGPFTIGCYSRANPPSPPVGGGALHLRCGAQLAAVRPSSEGNLGWLLSTTWLPRQGKCTAVTRTSCRSRVLVFHYR